MNFSEAMFYENYFTTDFHTNTVISRRVCPLVKMALKTVIRPIYAGCPEGAYRVLKRVDFFFFFFVVYTNRYINLFIKLSPLLLGMYCFDCLQQKQANQNPFLSLILRGRGPTHPYLCDVNASFDIFIKDGLSRAILF